MIGLAHPAGGVISSSTDVASLLSLLPLAAQPDMAMLAASRKKEHDLAGQETKKNMLGYTPANRGKTENMHEFLLIRHKGLALFLTASSHIRRVTMPARRITSNMHRLSPHRLPHLLLRPADIGRWYSVPCGEGMVKMFVDKQ